MRTLTRVGDGYAWALICFGLMLAHPDRLLIFYHSSLAFALELIIYKVVKISSARMRPCDIFPQITTLINIPDQYSFPSGHTAASFVMAYISATYIPEVFPAFLLIAIGIGISRVYLGVHYPSDVLVGACIGIGCAWGTQQIALYFLTQN